MLTCNYCDKRGLLIYPVRYAVASPYGAQAVPALSGNFRIEGAPQQIGDARYTLRALRPGYLYTYDERRARLKAYVVMPTGHLWNFPLEYNPPHPGRIPFSCVDPGEIVRAYCVDIAHTPNDPATRLWIGWSNTAWTKALQKKIGQSSWRKKHMQCIDVAAMLAATAPHTGEFNASKQQVAHFAADAGEMAKAFSFSNTPPAEENKRHAWAGKMAEIMAAQAPHHKGYVVAINDPVGFVNDLSELCVPGLAAGFDEKLYQTKTIADLLAMTEQGVRREARNAVAFDAKVAQMAENHPDGDTYGSLKTVWRVVQAGGPASYARKQSEKRKKYGADQAARQQAAEDEAWHELTHDDGKPTLDQQKLKAFPAIYDAALKAFEPRFIKLVTAHVAWLKSEQLANWMEGVHDVNDIRSGHAYSESLAQCIGKAVASQACQDQLTLWLSQSSLSDPGNLYGRALLYNQDDLIAATESQLKGSDIQFENILNLYKGAVARLDATPYAPQLIDRLALTTANVIGKSLRDASQGVALSLAMIHLHLLAGVTIKASNMSAADVSRWAITQARARGIELKTDRQQTRRDAYQQAKGTVRSSAMGRRMIAYELDIASLEREGRIAAGSIKGISIPDITLAQKWLGSSVPAEFRLGVATTLVQMLALNFAMDDLAHNDQFNERETQVKAALAAVSLTSTLVETVAVSVQKSGEHPLGAFILRQWAVSEKLVRGIVQGARFAGMLAGVLAGAYDIFFNATSAYEDDKILLASLYVISGSSGAAISVIAVFSMSSLFWPLLITSFVMALTIAAINDSALKAWISRCDFAVGEKYSSFDKQLKAYQEAVGA